MDEPHTAPDPVPAREALLQALLAGLPRIPLHGQTADWVAILRGHVVAAGLDPVEVSAWVRDRGGHEATTYAPAAGQAQRDRSVRPPLHPRTYFAVPALALVAPQAR